MDQPCQRSRFYCRCQRGPRPFGLSCPALVCWHNIFKPTALELVADPAVLYAPAPEDADECAGPDVGISRRICPSALASGQSLSLRDHVTMRDLFNRDEIDLLMTFNPGDATSLVAQGILPETITAGGLTAGALEIHIL